MSLSIFFDKGDFIIKFVIFDLSPFSPSSSSINNGDIDFILFCSKVFSTPIILYNFFIILGSLVSKRPLVV